MSGPGAASAVQNRASCMHNTRPGLCQLCRTGHYACTNTGTPPPKRKLQESPLLPVRAVKVNRGCPRGTSQLLDRVAGPECALHCWVVYVQHLSKM
eukprot:1159929-Pelagomonas_calceolata.AAC.20